VTGGKTSAPALDGKKARGLLGEAGGAGKGAKGEGEGTMVVCVAEEKRREIVAKNLLKDLSDSGDNEHKLMYAYTLLSAAAGKGGGRKEEVFFCVSCIGFCRIFLCLF